MKNKAILFLSLITISGLCAVKNATISANKEMKRYASTQPTILAMGKRPAESGLFREESESREAEKQKLIRDEQDLARLSDRIEGIISSYTSGAIGRLKFDSDAPRLLEMIISLSTRFKELSRNYELDEETRSNYSRLGIMASQTAKRLSNTISAIREQSYRRPESSSLSLPPLPKGPPMPPAPSFDKALYNSIFSPELYQVLSSEEIDALSDLVASGRISNQETVESVYQELASEFQDNPDVLSALDNTYAAIQAARGWAE